VHTQSWFCVYVFVSVYMCTCVCVYVNCIQAFTWRCEGWACVNQGSRSWIFRTFSF
jgi:hypothetical protein